MDDIVGPLGQAILAAIAASGVIVIAFALLFGSGNHLGPLGEYIVAVLNSALG